MIELKMTRWLLGYVRFSISGGTERFMNQCARSGVPTWEMRGGSAPSACVLAGGYRDLHHVARAAGVRVRITEKHGFPFATKRVRRRGGILAGTAVFFLILIVLSLHVWSVEIDGLEEIPEKQIQAALKEEGLVSGAWKRNVDSHAISESLMLQFPDLSWVSVNTRGCTVVVELAEKAKKPDLDVQKTPCNLVASESGLVVSSDIYSGTAQIREGDGIVKGQLLVSGVVEDQSGGNYLKHAAGKIIAETNRTFTAEVDLQQEEEFYTGETITRKSLTLFGITVPLTFQQTPKGQYQVERTRTRVQAGTSFLPLSWYEEVYRGTEIRQITLTQEQAVEKAKAMVAEQQKSQMKDGKVISQEETVTINNNKLIYTVLAKCQEDIAVESEILLGTQPGQDSASDTPG